VLSSYVAFGYLVYNSGMTSTFLQNLRAQAALMHENIHTGITRAGFAVRPAGQWPFPQTNPATGVPQASPAVTHQPSGYSDPQLFTDSGGKLPSENQAAFEARTGSRRTGQPPFPETGQPVLPDYSADASRQPAAGYPGASGFDFADVSNQSAKLLAMIDAEIARPMNSQEYEAQMLNTAPRAGETAEQTAYRLRAERADNPLVAQPIR
jgi:hypothetical protein